VRVPVPLSVVPYGTSSASATLVGVVVARGVRGCTTIFPQGMTLRPEICNKLTCPSIATTIFCFQS
jgi:hypothetical protein